MELESRRQEAPSINLSALIDIVFILVIFVVLAANFQRLKGIEVDLPEAAATSTLEDKALTITVPRKGPIQLDDVPVEADRLRAELQHRRLSHESIILKSDGAADFERAVQVLAEARAAGFESVSIATVETAEGASP